MESLKQRGLATRRDIPVKILAKGELSKALTVNVHGVSAQRLVEAIEKAGGTIQLIESTWRFPSPERFGGYRPLCSTATVAAIGRSAR